MIFMIGLLKRRRPERLDELASQTYGTNKKKNQKQKKIPKKKKKYGEFFRANRAKKKINRVRKDVRKHYQKFSLYQSYFSTTLNLYRLTT